MVAKYKPPVPQVVVTDSPQLARHCAALFGCYARLVPDLQADTKQLLRQAGAWAQERGLWRGDGAVLVLAGKYEANADMQPELSVALQAGAGAAGGAALRHLRRTQSITA